MDDRAIERLLYQWTETGDIRPFIKVLKTLAEENVRLSSDIKKLSDDLLKAYTELSYWRHNDGST